jgi:hypothetical protein
LKPITPVGLAAAARPRTEGRIDGHRNQTDRG